MSVNTPLDNNQVWELYQTDAKELMEIAAAKRKSVSQDKVELCAIINAKTGRCSEDCAFCAQSIHYQTDITDRSLTDVEDIIRYAKTLEGYGIKRLSLVSSGRGVSDDDLDK